MAKRDELRRDENIGRMKLVSALATLAVSAIAVIQNAKKTPGEQSRNENAGMGTVDAVTTLISAITKKR